MQYLECVNKEFNHYFIVDYPTDLPYQSFCIEKSTNYKKIYIRLKLFKNKIYDYIKR